MAPKHKQSDAVPKLVRIESLEPRVLYSAEAAPWLALVDADRSPHDDRLSNDFPLAHLNPVSLEIKSSASDYPDTQLVGLDMRSSNASVTQVVLVDATHTDIEALLELLQKNLSGDEQIAIVTLQDSDDPLSAIADVLSRYDDLQAVHIVSHAVDGAIQLGDRVIGRAELLGDAATVALWGDALQEDGDILLYGCNLSASAEGHLFAQTLSDLTSADVASSNDVTGHALRNGNWNLEVNVGPVETEVIAPAVVQSDWQGSLDITTGLIHHWALDGNGNDSAGSANMTLHNGVGSPTGLIGQAGDFNDSTSLLKHGEVGSWLYGGFGFGDFSIALWMHVDGANDGAQLMGNIVGSSTGYSLQFDASGHLVFTVSSGTSTQQISSANPVDDSDWRHIVATRDGGVLSLRIYNRATGTTDYIETVDTGLVVVVGATQSTRFGSTTATSGDYDGLLDDIRVYNRVLTPVDAGELIAMVVGGDQVLVVNEPVQLDANGEAAVTNNVLMTIDSDTPDTQLVYTITQKGSVASFVLNGIPLGVNDTFTQADINNGLLTVKSPIPLTSADSIGFSVYDGQASTSHDVFVIEIGQDQNQPPTDLTSSSGFFVNENAVAGTLVGSATTTDVDDASHIYTLLDDAGGLFTIDANTGNVYVASGAVLNFENSSSHQIEVQATDSAAQSISGVFEVTVGDINDAPYFTQPVSISPVLEDDVTNNGHLVGDLFASSFYDQDSGDSMTGIALIANNSTPGTGKWQYQTGGGAWVDVGTVSKADTLVLGVDDRVRYVPVSNFNGTIGTLVVHAIDDSLGLGAPPVPYRDTSLFDNNGQPTTTRISLFSTGVGGVVTPVNDAPNFAYVNQQLRIDENAPVGSSLGFVIGHDVDDTTLSYSLTGNSGGRFTIDSVTGEVTVLNNVMLNYEVNTFHQITVEITDSASQVYSAAFPVLVNDVNEAPHSLTENAPMSVVENAAVGTVVGTVTGQDVDDVSLTYSLVDNAGGRFAINASTGDITVADASLLDYETDVSHQVVVQASDAAGLNLTQVFSVAIVNEDEAPYDIVPAFALMVNENAAAGTSVGSVTGMDVDNLPLSYSLSNDAAGRFAIDANTGEISVLNAGLLDYETASSHTIEVVVEDAAGLTFAKSLNVLVNNINEAPHAIISNGPLSVVENASAGTSIDVLVGQDVDDTTLTYSLGDDANGRFAIHAVTGELSVLDSVQLDYESNSSHQISVQVTDSSGLTYTENFAVTVTDVNEAPHDIVALSALVVVENAANGSVVGIVAGQDVDDANVTYSLLDDANGRFAIDALTGQVLVLDGSLLDHETNATHQITIAVEDLSGLSYTESFLVNVVDENEAPHGINVTVPLIVIENATNGALVGAVAGDDVDDTTLTYALLNNANGRFSIDTATGEVFVLDGSQLDYESSSSHLITVEVQDAAGLSYTQNVMVNVTNQNEAPNAITTTPLAITENAASGTLVGVATGHDVDDTTLNYTLIDDATGRFAIDSVTGEVTVLDGSQLDFEANNAHQITVQVQDAAGLSLERSFTVNITDENEAPHDINLAAPISVLEQAANGTSLGIVIGQDVDDTALSYSLTNDANGRFAINAATGELSVLDGTQLDHEAATSHQITISVQDAGGLAYSETISVDVLNENEAPTQLNAQTPFSVIEHADSGVLVGAVIGQDAEDTSLSYSLVNDANGRFSIDAATGAVYVLDGSQLDFEENTSHQVTILVSDSDGLSLQKDFTVNVVNANDAPQLMSASVNSIVEDDTAPNGELISAIFNSAFSDADSGDTLAGIGIVDNAASADGIWQFKIGAGSWQNIPVLSTSNALVLSVNDEIRFLPAANYYGVPDALTVFGLDSSYAGEYSDENQNQFINLSGLNSTAVSQASANVYINVTPVNDEEQLVHNLGASVLLNDTLTLSNTMLAVSDIDHARDELVFTQDGTWSGIELQVNGMPVNSFTQQQLDLGMVDFLSVGSEAGTQNLPLIVDDGEGSKTPINFVVVVEEPVPEPEPAAALPEPIEYVEEYVLTAAPVQPLASVVSFTSEEQMNNNSVVQSEADSDSESESGLPTSLGPSDTGEQSESEQEAVPSLGQAVMSSLQVPDFKTTGRTALDAADIAGVLSEPRHVIHKAIKLNAAEQVELQMASLLSLEPLTTAESSVFTNQSENPGLQNSLDKLQQQFSKAADSMEGRAVARDSVIGFSLSVTAGFLVWMLRSGALLASMFSISPLWRQLDPLPILSSSTEDTALSNDQDDRVEELFAEQSKS